VKAVRHVWWCWHRYVAVAWRQGSVAWQVWAAMYLQQGSGIACVCVKVGWCPMEPKW